MQLARDGQTVAAIISLAAQHQDALRGKRGVTSGKKLHHAVRGVLHQHQAGNAALAGAAIHFAHFGRRENLHNRLATTMVISSCNSEEPVHWFTASMVRAMSSEESAAEYFTISSFRRSSPNISP